MEQRTDGNTFHHIANDARLAACGNNGVDTRTASHVSGLQFGAHAAGAEARNAVPGNRAQCVINAVNIFNQFCLRIAARICCI